MPEPAHPKNHYDSLKREVDGYIKYSHTWSIVWANVYYLLRVTLIVLAACVAAKDSLPRIASIAAVLSLLVAVGTLPPSRCAGPRIPRCRRAPTIGWRTEWPPGPRTEDCVSRHAASTRGEG